MNPVQGAQGQTASNTGGDRTDRPGRADSVADGEHAGRDTVTHPRILLVEDDPVSSAFLQDALRGLPAEVHAAPTAAEALQVALGMPPALCLIDAHLPDASGTELLQQLRRSGIDAAALAHTAEPSPALHSRLMEAGFAAVLTKPISIAQLHDAVRAALAGRHGAVDPALAASTTTDADAGITASVLPELAGSSHTTLAVWDDAAALRALNGNTAIMAGMRTLFRTELAQALPRITALHAAGDITALHGELHKLKAATAFVGAAQLAAAVTALSADMQGTQAHVAFAASAQRLLQER